MEKEDKMIVTFRFFLVAAATVAGSMAMAAPSVTVDDVKTGAPWSTITVAYTLSGVDADLDYKIAFDVTANGVTRGVTNAAAKLTDGTASKAIDTAKLFGKETVDTKAKVKVTLIAIKPLGGVQLWENGPYWAECNVGATKPGEYGYYFWWGDTVGYTSSGGTWTVNRYYSGVTWVSSTGTRMSSSPFSSSSCPTDGKTMAQLQSAGYIDSTGNLVAKYDAATAHLGAPWRMPTDEEIRALVDNCTTTWTTRDGAYGHLITGKGAYKSKSIFLPAAGEGYDSYFDQPGSCGIYWSTTPRSNNFYYVLVLNFGSSYFCRSDGGARHVGLPVRPLRAFTK